MKYTFDYIESNGLLLFKYIRGSHCHGINTPTSDIDEGGVYYLPNESMLGLGRDYTDTIEDDTHDKVWYEIGKFCQLLLKSNPTMIEALFVDDKFIAYMHPAFKVLRDNRDMFITKECFDPFTGYAISQIKKARGLNKMIAQPIIDRKEVIDFCYITYGNDTMPIKNWLDIHGISETDISLAKMNHAKDAYAVFQYPGGFYKVGANDVHINNLPKGLTAVGTLFFNKDAYSKHCTDYKHYKEWESKRNPVRYVSNLKKNYDAKNMCECMRLVNMGIEIAKTGKINVNREKIDRELLLDIKNHGFTYDEIIEMITEKQEEMNIAMEESSIPDKPDYDKLNDILLTIRKELNKK